MNDVIKLLLKESIDLELNIGDLYQIFSAKFPQDYNFWWKISIEEINHAALIESINDNFLTENILTADSIRKQADDLMKMNHFIKKQTEMFKFGSPARLDAFKLAFEIENSIGETHFEIFMTASSDSSVAKILQKLNGDDINHAQRMDKYMKENNIVF